MVFDVISPLLLLRLLFLGDAGVRQPGNEAAVGDGPLAVHDHAVRVCGGECDGVVLLGDNIYQHGINEAVDSAFLRNFAEMWSDVGPQYYVPGNHDLPDLDLPGNADRRVVDVAGLRVVGIGGSPDHRKDPYEYEEDEIRALELPEADILLSHTPPARTALDLVPRRGAHVGSEAIRERALCHRGALVCGHIHESPGTELLGECFCFNPGGLGRPFGRAQVGFLIWEVEGLRSEHLDLESGTSTWWSYRYGESELLELVRQ